MRYIIDGCNFIKRFAGGSPFDFEGEKKTFISRLDRYALGKKVKITVVFDSRMPSYENLGKLSVIHAEDADERIAGEVKKLVHPAQTAVVSDDRAVQKAAAAGGAAIIGVVKFDAFLSKSLNEAGNVSPAGSEKPSPDNMSSEEIKEWEDYFRGR
jgi:predicted RNA-binding protein with PIN domain